VNAEVIAVGSELLTPSRIDTNSLYLTQKLNERGIEVVGKSVVGDDRERLANEIRRARKSSPLIIMTGGLGPTLDDVSREAAADALGLQLDFHQEIVDAIEARFQRRGRAMSENNRRQGYILRGAEILPNANGTAPGQWLRDDTGILVLLPGPPRELKPMFEGQCLPRLAQIASSYQYYTLSLRVTGLPESELDQRIGPIYSEEKRVATTILASPGEIQIHLRARAANVEEARRIAESLGEKVEAELGSHVFTREDESMEQVIARLYRGRGMTLAAAESCTGGLLAEKITSVPGSSEYFLGGFVTYTEAAKTAWLGVSESTLQQHGAVSKQVAEEMARAVRAKAKATVGVSTTGIAGPGGGTEQTPVGTVFIGLADENGVEVAEIHAGGERDLVRQWAVQKAFDLIRRKAL
jgi:competence/damage-inducible protein CinA-like protein